MGNPHFYPYSGHHTYWVEIEGHRTPCGLCQGFLYESADDSVGLQEVVSCEYLLGEVSLGYNMPGQDENQSAFPFPDGCNRFKLKVPKCPAPAYSRSGKCLAEMVMVFDWTRIDFEDDLLVSTLPSEVFDRPDAEDYEIRRWKCPECDTILDHIGHHPKASVVRA